MSGHEISTDNNHSTIPFYDCTFFYGHIQISQLIHNIRAWFPNASQIEIFQIPPKLKFSPIRSPEIENLSNIST